METQKINANFQTVIEKVNVRIQGLEVSGKKADTKNALIKFVDFLSSLNDEQKFCLQYLILDIFISDADEVKEQIEHFQYNLKVKGLL